VQFSVCPRATGSNASGACACARCEPLRRQREHAFVSEIHGDDMAGSFRPHESFLGEPRLRKMCSASVARIRLSSRDWIISVGASTTGSAWMASQTTSYKARSAAGVKNPRCERGPPLRVVNGFSST